MNDIKRIEKNKNIRKPFHLTLTIRIFSILFLEIKNNIFIYVPDQCRKIKLFRL